MAGAPEAVEGTLAIGEVAALAGLRPSAIRYYERAGLLPAPERQAGRRRFEAGVLDLLRAIEVAKQAGFSLAEIRRLMTGFDAAIAPSARWRPLAEAKIDELDRLAERIDGMRALLRRGLECGCLRLEDCELLTRPRG